MFSLSRMIRMQVLFALDLTTIVFSVEGSGLKRDD